MSYLSISSIAEYADSLAPCTVELLSIEVASPAK